MGSGNCQRTCVLFPPTVRETIRRNFERFAWVKSWVDLKAAEKALGDFDDEFLRRSVPSQDVGRAMGSAPWYPPCPNCGKPADYETFDPLRSWQVRCRHCQALFPTNDFAAFLESGRDEQGIFRYALADRSLLAPSPNAKIPVVDDGKGWVDQQGRRHFFVPVACRARWSVLFGLLRQWTWAFLVTDDARFAFKVALLLHRIAQVYPEMDFYPYAQLGAFESYGHSRLGRIFGRISECGVAVTCSEAYDAVKPVLSDPHLLDTIESNLLREILRSFQEHPPRIRANIGHTHWAYAMVALALNDADALAWLEDEGWDENIIRVFAELVDRDGVGMECSPGYNFGWANGFWEMALLLERTDLGQRLRLMERFGAVLKRMVKAPYRLLVAGVTPNIGDHGQCGELRASLPSPQLCASAFAHFGDPELAAMAFHANGEKWDGIHLDITHPDPKGIVAKMQTAVGKTPPSPVPATSFLRDGYGLISLTTSLAPRHSSPLWVWFYFGRNAHFGHGHRDQLNFGLICQGMDLLPDLGYPDWTIEHPYSDHFVRNTLSHNTVVIDRTPQRPSYSGKCLAFAETPVASFALVDASAAYAPHRVVRLLILLPTEQGGYLLDIVWVRGGKEHLLSLHTAPAEVEGIFRSVTDTPELFCDASTESGLPFLGWRGVAETMTAPFVADFRLSDAPVIVRFHCLTEAQRFLAEAIATQRSGGRVLPYLLQRRDGDRSVFVTALEPFTEKPFLAEATLFPLTPMDGQQTGDAVAVRLGFADGTTDWVFADLTGTRLWQFGDGIVVRGRIAVVRQTLKGTEALLWHGDMLQVGAQGVQLPAAEANGRVRGFSGGWDSAWLLTDAPLTENPFTLHSHFVRVEAETERDTAFVWQDTERMPDGVRLHLGDTHLIAGGRDGAWRHLIAEGMPVAVPALFVGSW